MRPYLCKTNPIPGGRGRNTEALAMPEAGTRRSSAHRVLDSMRRHGAKNADYRGGVTCLYDTQLLGACLHASGCGGHSRPGAVRGMPEVPIAPPATGPPEGWAAVGFVSPASFNRGLWARLLRVLGSLPLILGSERVRIWVFDRFNPGLIRCQIGLPMATSLSYPSD